MKKLTLCLLVAISLSGQKLLSQSSLPQFGVYSAEELNMKDCSFEKNAEAVLLLDEAYTDYDDNYPMITTRRIRIKILNERGLDRANISIRFYSKDDYQFIRNIEGITYTDEGTYTLNNKNIYTDKGPLYSKMKFAMPNVKPGSIIEYKYEMLQKNYDLDEWSFQSDIPTLKSCYLVHIHPRGEFSYVVTKKFNYPVVIKPIKDEGKIYFE